MQTNKRKTGDMNFISDLKGSKQKKKYYGKQRWAIYNECLYTEQYAINIH